MSLIINNSKIIEELLETKPELYEYLHYPTPKMCAIILQKKPEILKSVVDGTLDYQAVEIIQIFLGKWISKISRNDLIRTLARQFPQICKYLNKPDPGMVEALIQANPYVILHLRDLHEDQLALAVKLKPKTILMIQNPSDKLIRIAVMQNPDLVQELTVPEHILSELVYAIPDVIQYISNPSIDIQRSCVLSDPHMIKHIENPSQEIIKIAFDKDPFIVIYLEDQPEEMYLKAVATNWQILNHIKAKYQTYAVCKEAITRSKRFSVVYDIKDADLRLRLMEELH